ncbi:MAG: outer membrane protein assembly factor BamA [Rikenellaceae bacterium]
MLKDLDPKRYRIRKINVEGVEMIDPKILASSAGLNEGDSITLPSTFVATTIERLWNQRRYADVRLEAEIIGEDVILELILKEQPRVFNWAITGIPNGKKTELTEKLKLRRNSELSDYVLDKNVNAIKTYYADKGFHNAEVETKIVPDTTNEAMVNVTFDVKPNKKVKVAEVIFEGNEAFSDKKLRSTFKKTNQRSINIFKSRKFVEEEFENDKELLIDFYNSKGYRNATIVSDTTYSIDSVSLGVKLKVSEGNRYYIRNITWVGNSRYETEFLQRMFGVTRGDVYDKKSMYKRLGIGAEANPDEMSVLTLYQNDGYLMSQIDPAEIIIGADSIDLELKLFEGKPFTIGNVEISGNLRVDDEVIRRELYTRPGELYNRSLLMQTIRTLSSMGHFNPEAIMPDINPVTNSLVDVGWILEEQASDQFNVAGGWGSGSFVGSIGVTLNNISTSNMFDKGAWKPYPMGQNQRLSIQAQSNGSYYKSLAASFTDPWMGGRKPNSFTVSVHYSDQNDAYYAWQEAEKYFRTFGVAAGLGKRLTWPDPYFSIYGEVSYERYMLQDWSSFVMEDGDANLLSAKFVMSRNSVDQPTYPRRGSEFTFSLQLTPPYSLVDGKDYSDDDMDDDVRYKMIEFHKWNLKSTWYQSFMRNSNLVLKLSAEMGYLGSYNKDKLSPFERFEVGGDGMSGYTYYGIDVISLRGYDDGALDPSGEYSIGYNKYTAELRYPVILEPSSQIYLLAFLEGGNGFSSWRDFSPFDIKRSAGFGVRLYLPIVGMLGIDWGYGFDPATGSTSKSGSQFHFVMGQQF